MSEFSGLKNLKYVDLTHTLSSTVPHWSGGCGFLHKTISDYSNSISGAQFRVQSLEMSAGVGTHMDAPAHCFPGGMDIANLSLEQLIVPCVKLDISTKAHASYQLSPEDIIDFENEYGIIEKIP